MGEVIKVGIAALDICVAPDSITTIGLGSCVGVVLYDEAKKTAGLVHVMLPDSTRIRENANRAKFADTGITLLLERLLELGIYKRSLKAKIAGGAKMFDFSRAGNVQGIGEQNVKAVKEILMQNQIPLIAEDVGLNYGRTIVFDPKSCQMHVMSAGRVEKVL